LGRGLPIPSPLSAHLPNNFKKEKEKKGKSSRIERKGGEILYR